MVLYWRGSGLSSLTEPSVSVSVVVCLQRLHYSSAFRRIRSWSPLFSALHGRVFDIIASLGLTGHSYANDSQVYISAPVVDSQQAASV